jgi:hypothetical protein
MLMSPYHFDGYLDPTSVENRIWGDGIGTSWCDAGSQGYCPVRCWKSMVSYHTQI